MTEINVEIPEEKPENVDEIKQDVAKLEGKVETLEEVVSEPPKVPEHKHAFHEEIMNRLDRAETTIDDLVKHEVDRTVKEKTEPKPSEEAPEEEEKKEFSAVETTATTEPRAPEPHEEQTIIEPPPARSRKETPPGVWGWLKKAGF
jgi:hypothetical protein